MNRKRIKEVRFVLGKEHFVLKCQNISFCGLYIDEVPTKWDSILDVFKSTLKHEQKVTGMINDLYALTHEQNDFATQSMLKWFIDEQVEEEETAQTIIDNIKMIKDNGYGIYMLDKELGARTYTQAAPLNGSL